MLDTIRNRRSIRKYEDRPIEPAIVEQLKEAMLRAPSGRNLQPWSFVFVTDRKLLAALGRARPDFSAFIGTAPLGVVIAADASVTDTWIEDCSIAAATLQLAATELGLGSCWTQIRVREHEDGRPAEAFVREVLELPGRLSVLCMVAVGYPASQPAPKDRDKLAWDSVSERP